MSGRLRTYGLVLVLALAFGAVGPNGERPVVPDVAGCPPLPQAVDGDPGAVSATVDRRDVKVASDVIGATRPQPLGALRDLFAAPVRWSLQEQVSLPSSGLVVELWTDGDGVALDAEAFDALSMVPFAVDAADPRLAALLDCYERRVLDDGELDGVQLRLLVPGDPWTCVRGWRLQPPDAHGPCDATGLSVPALFGQPGTVVVAPGRPPAEGLAAERAALVLVHELVHQLDDHLGPYPYPWDWRSYEQRAHYVERAVLAAVRDGSLDLPLPILWAR